MLISPHITFRGGVRLEDGPHGARLVTPRGVVPVGTEESVFAALVRRVAAGDADEDALCALAGEDGGAGPALVYYHLARLAPLCEYRYADPADGRVLLTLAPFSSRFMLLMPTIPADARLVLSRFAYLRRLGDELVLESPRCLARVTIASPAVAALLMELSRPRPRDEIDGEATGRATDPQIDAVAGRPATARGAVASGLSADALATVLSVLVGAELLVEVDGEGREDDARAPVLAQWDFHDLLFHSRSRLGRHDYPSGATFRFAGRAPAPPALKPPMSAERVSLARPDLTTLCEQDQSFTRVLERRRSIRAHGPAPITLAQLGEFLYRAARVKEFVPADPRNPRSYDSTWRPHPGGGAMYELELYLTVRACAGLASGLYHYAPDRHELERLSCLTPDALALLEHACASAGLDEPPQVLITLASRFERMSWKYESMAYAATLKNVGALLQTMYLVAAAMGLAPCALGGGDADRFARAAGLDYFAESSVGEFMLGSCQPSAVR